MRKIVSVNEYVEKHELLLERKSFNTEDIRTSITLLSSGDYKVLLKAVGSLSRYATKDVRYLEKYVTFEIYPRLVSLLEREDIVILKYTLKMLAMLAKHNFMAKLNFRDIVICSELATRCYIECDDSFIRECSSLLLLQHVKYNELVSNQIYSDELIGAIFEVMTNIKDVDVLWNSLNLFYLLLDIEMAKEDIPRNGFFSIRALLCLLDCEVEGVKELTIDIFYKLSSWRTRNIIILLTKEHVLQVLVTFLMIKSEKASLFERVFDIIQNCISNEECALEFAQTIEFLEFIGWLKRCSNRSLLSALPILTIMSKIPKLKQNFYDLCFDQLVLSWMKYHHESFVLYLLQIINNLTEHKRCCKTFCKYIVVKTISDYILKDNLPIDPHGELALKALRNLLVRSPEILDHFIACDCIDLIKDFFLTKQRELSPRGYADVIGMIHLLMVTPKCAQNLLVQPVLQKIFQLYRKQREFKFKMLNLINALIKYVDFRNYIVEYGRSDYLLNGLRNDKTSYGLQLHLEVISNLVKYQEIAYILIDLDLLSYMKANRKSLRSKIVDDIIEDLYDYCLTVKFYETQRLEAHNKIDEKFYLIQDGDLTTTSLLSMDFSTITSPVYVVSVMLVKIIRDVEKTISHHSSNTSIKHSCSKIRVLGISSNMVQSNVKLKAVCEHGGVPQNLLLQRMGCSSKDINFYEDYYLERYILNLMKKLYYSDDAPKTWKERIEYIAKFVARQMSGIYPNLKKNEEEKIFNDHISKLKESVGLPIIPIGYLRIGYYCERALLFKVLCDNLFVPATLCKRDVGIYWNEVSFKVIHDGQSFVNQDGGVYVVDLMCNVGHLMAINSLEAREYLCIDTCLSK